MKKNIKYIVVIATLVICVNSLFAQNTECSGMSRVAAQGSFTLGYNYSFTTNANGDVTFVCEMLDAKTSVNGYAWTYNPSFAEVGMSSVSGQKYTKTFPGQLNGATFKVACKFSYAGGMSVTQTLSYTVGNNCGIIPGAPTLTTTTVTSITSTTAVSGGNITAAGTSTVAARGVCWSPQTKPTVDLLTKTVNGIGVGSFASNLTGLTPGVKYYVRAYATNNAGTNYGNELSFTAPDTEAPTAFTASSGTPMSTSVPINLNATDNSGSITYTISYGALPTVLTVQGTSGTLLTYMVTGLSIATNYTFSIAAKDATGNGAINSPMIVTATTRPGVTSAPIPTVDHNAVVSIFSDTYSSISGTLFNPMGWQNTIVSSFQISGNAILKYTNFDFQESELGSDVDAVTTGMAKIHFDVWTEEDATLKVTLVNRTPHTEIAYTLPPLVKEEWNRYDIALSEFENYSGSATNSFYLLKIESLGSSINNLKTIYIDNIYFWRLFTGLQNRTISDEISCYPNPVKDKLTIAAKSEIKQIVVRSLLGQTVKIIAVDEMEKSIDMSELSAGNYMISIQLTNGQFSKQKLIKM